jgi:hypothetical protein
MGGWKGLPGQSSAIAAPWALPMLDIQGRPGLLNAPAATATQMDPQGWG